MDHRLNNTVTLSIAARSNYYLADRSSLNGPTLIDLMIQMGRGPVVKALFELAAKAQNLVVSAPESDELRKFAYSLVWHYHCLHNCKALDVLKKKASRQKRKLQKLKSVEATFHIQFEALTNALCELTRYIIPQPGHLPTIMWSSPPRDQLRSGELSPASIARLCRVSPEFSPLEILDGLAEFAKVAPWMREGASLSFEYFADPAQRMEFLEACGALLDKVEVLKRLATRRHSLANAETEANNALEQLQLAWCEARKGERFPPSVGSMVAETMARTATLRK